MEQQIQFNVIPSGKELILRQGKAEEIKYQKSIVINGTLAAPFQFLQGRGELDEKEIHLLVDNENVKLILVVGDIDPSTTHTITGALKYNAELLAFGINTSKRFTIKEFIKFIRERRFFFDDKSEHEKLVRGLMVWSAKVDIEVKDFNDNRGNSLFQLETKVKKAEGFIENFMLNIALFDGYQKVKFKVEIGLDPKTTGVDLFLISDELLEIGYQHREKIMGEEVKKFDKYSFSKVVLS